jgi:uncharacterized protein (TIGR03435 family)
MTHPAFWHTLGSTLSNSISAHLVACLSGAALVNHLWQSTVVVLAAWLLALCMRGNPARTRYWVWMTASVKFLIPFSLFVAVGESLRLVVAAPVQSPRFATVMQQIAQPFPHASTPVGVTDFGFAPQTQVAASNSHWLPIALACVWLCGFLTVVFSWARSWRQLRATARSAVAVAPQGMRHAAIPILASDRLLEPGVFGILRPVLLLPRSITERLSPQQLAAILAHEMAHVRRRDNLTSALHMAVCALFWFHPATWWIGARLMEERECACDESVLQSGNPAELYAESILSVCRFYVESPLACMSGVTGADLKQRIVRIMSGHATRRLGLGRTLLLASAALLIVAAPVTLGLVHITAVRAQATAPAKDQDLAGTWQGTLHAGQDLRTIIKIVKQPNGSYKSDFYSIDQGARPISVDTTTLQGSTVKYSITAIGGTYEGKLSADGNTINGNWSQGPTPLPLVLTRSTPETAWTIPPPPPVIPPMAANASPAFEVATIKPTRPEERGKGFMVDGRRLHVVNMGLIDLMTISYDVQAKQILGLPRWADTDKYDMDAVPDGQGEPNLKQWKEMVQKLLADRFNLKLHREKRVLAVYALEAAKSGPKLVKGEDGDNVLPGFFFQGRPGNLHVTNATMVEFAQFMQSAVMDRPVVDQTGITGRWNFPLDWTPDDSQFGGMAASLPPPAKGTVPPPDLYTSIQEQDGLKLDATKAPADVLVIDHIDHPSPN